MRKDSQRTGITEETLIWSEVLPTGANEPVGLSRSHPTVDEEQKDPFGEGEDCGSKVSAAGSEG